MDGAAGDDARDGVGEHLDGTAPTEVHRDTVAHDRVVRRLPEAGKLDASRTEVESFANPATPRSVPP